MHQAVQGRLTAAHSHQYISHPFEMPAGATRLDVNFHYAPKRVGRYGNLLTLSVFDPDLERGTGHRQDPNQHVAITAASATPGYLPGALAPGRWDVMINCNLINPGEAVDYQLEITVGFDPQPEAVPLPRGTTRSRGAGWYRGDLHGHTDHSDGHWGVPGLLDFAHQHQLDFITLTDHNTVAGLAEMDSRSSDGLLTMGGFELTTFYGHALALGIRRPIDWRVHPGARPMTTIKAEVEAAGGLFIIAHPACPGDPICTGCHWEYTDVMPGSAGMVEVWNEHYSSGSNNEGSVELWYQWLNQGHRLYATVGTDIHGPADPALEFAFDVVYAQDLSESAILDAVRQGHHYMSSGPKLAFTGQSDSGTAAMIGGSLPAGECRLSIEWEACRAGDSLRLIVDGQVQDERGVAATGALSWVLAAGQANWCVIEIRSSQGDLRALTNPIFIGAV